MDGAYEHIYGMLIGCAAGDSMGMPAEMWSRGRIRAHFGTIDGFLPGPAENEISAGLKAYETTDDTIVTLIVAKAVIASDGNPDPLSIVHGIEKWAGENPKSRTVIGPSTRRAFEAIAKGVPVSEAGRYGETNGASMRISPVGAVSDVNDIPSLVDRVEKVCMPTHNTAPAISAASAVAAAVANGISGGNLRDMPAVAEKAAQAGAGRGYDVCTSSVCERIRFAVDLSCRTGDDEEFTGRLYDLLGCGLPSAEAVPAAIAIAFRSGGDVLRCARMCANLGGDTDTIGSISCAIVGAHTGIDGIPADVAEKLQEVNGYDFSGTAAALAEVRSRLVRS